MNCMGPQDATMLTLLDHGTAEQKERFLVPLVSGERRICFSMTERAAGSDATGMRTTAVRDGEDWILNSEKWFSSSASISDYALVMARTDAGAPGTGSSPRSWSSCPTPATRSSGISRPCTRLSGRVLDAMPRSASGTCACRTPT